MLQLRMLPCPSRVQEVNQTLEEEGKTLGIPIFIEEVARTDRLFHQYKMNHEIPEWQHANITASPVLRAVSNGPDYWPLIQKLYRMTRIPQFNPNNENVKFSERMIIMKRVQTQINIARAHGMPLLPNKVRPL
eukprot:1183559-Prorocentrum_minimum.AAC.3